MHIIIQCPYYHNDWVDIYEDFFRKYPNAKIIFKEDRDNTLYVC